MFTYIKSEPGLWTVGHHDQSGQWIAESDHNSEEKAAKRVHYLNGGLAPQASHEQLVVGVIAAILLLPNRLKPDCVKLTDYAAVQWAREIMETVYKTEEE